MRIVATPRRPMAGAIVDLSIVATTLLALIFAAMLARGLSPFHQLGASSPAAGGASPARLDGAGRYPTSGTVALGSNLRGSVVVTNVADEPAGRDLELVLTSADSVTQAKGASVRGTARMDGMGGSVDAIAQDRGDGNYLIPLRFPMRGTWHVTISVDDGASEQPLSLDLVVQ